MTISTGVRNKAKNSPHLTAETVRDIFDYDPETGILIWKINRLKTKVGDRAGSRGPDGRWRVGYKYKDYLVSRIAWLFVYGKWPEYDIDHIDLNPGNDRISNLRDITHSHNAANTRVRFENNTGVKGVHWDQRRALYKATIMKNGKTYNLGRFLTLEQAKAAYDSKAREFFGEAARS